MLTTRGPLPPPDPHVLSVRINMLVGAKQRHHGRNLHILGTNQRGPYCGGLVSGTADFVSLSSLALRSSTPMTR